MIITGNISYGVGPDLWPIPWEENKNLDRAYRLRQLADKMQSAIDHKMNPGVSRQNPTARRARIAAGMQLDGERLIKIQSILNGVAGLIESNQLPDFLKVSNKAHVETLLHRFEYADSKHLNQLGIKSREDWDKAQEYIKRFCSDNEPDPIQKRIKEIERGLIGNKIPGFFPTPQPEIEFMCNQIDLRGKKVCEPSAGNGLIAQEILKYTNDLYCCEINYTLRELLELKGFFVVEHDFLQHESQYDAIVMNPPFENFQDIDHVYHAYSLLKKPGGSMASIMSDGVFYNKKSKPAQFRQWLETRNAQVIPLGKAFKKGGMDRIRTTGVSSRLVVIYC